MNTFVILYNLQSYLMNKILKYKVGFAFYNLWNGIHFELFINHIVINISFITHDIDDIIVLYEKNFGDGVMHYIDEYHFNDINHVYDFIDNVFDTIKPPQIYL
jgi:hypothetical protein